MASANSNLHKAKNAKNDEFYTQLNDVAKELMHYKAHFKDKVVFCNCDDPTWSAFWKYFHLNFAELGLKKLISTHYDRENPTYKMEYTGGDDNDIEVGVKVPLEGNGDFRNAECIELLKEADIVVTNEPFSLTRPFIEQLIEYNKQFLIIVNKNAITYKEIFPLIKDNKIWLGCTNVKEFIQPDGSLKKFGNVGWFTNLDVKKRHEKLVLWKHYTPEEYSHYDNYDAINVDKVSEIPCDYDGVMGVPITFLDHYNPDQFEIVSFRKGEDGKDLVFTREREREFNRTFVSLSDSEIRTNYRSKAHDLLRWKKSLCENSNSKETEPIDIFYPNATNLANTLVNDCTVNGKKTYVRVLIRKKAL